MPNKKRFLPGHIQAISKATSITFWYFNSVDDTILCYKCVESTGDVHDNSGGNCHMPNDKTETVPIITDGLCTTVTGIIMKDGDKVDQPTGDLIFSMRDTSGIL